MAIEHGTFTIYIEKNRSNNNDVQDKPANGKITIIMSKNGMHQLSYMSKIAANREP